MSGKAITTVVIPFFQRTQGLLTASVQSVLSQSGAHDVRVVVADDESPISAQDELPEEVKRDKRVIIIRQPNAGPGAARNTALNHAPTDTTYVALLDSDDVWHDGFLSAAIPILESGYDLFFADSRRYSQQESRFTWDADPALNLDGRAHKPIAGSDLAFEFEGNLFDFILIRSNILSPSSMIYRRAINPDLRFSTSLFNGQDRLFKLHLAKNVRKAAFTTNILCQEGEGINIFDSASWGTIKSISLISSYIEMSKTILAEVPMTPSQQRFVKSRVTASRQEFTASVLHLLRTGKSLPFDVIRKTFTNDPKCLAMFPKTIAKILFSRVFSRAY